MKTFAVEMSYISICFHCYVIAQQLPSPIDQVVRKAVVNRVLTLIGNPVAMPTSSPWLQTSLLYFDGVFSSTSNWRALLSCVAFGPLVDMACRVGAAEPAWVGERQVSQGRRGQCHREEGPVPQGLVWFGKLIYTGKAFSQTKTKRREKQKKEHRKVKVQ